jgi:hypothetical protein
MSKELRKENRVDALKKKYEADIAVAKTELDTYFESSVGVAEHPHIIESMDVLVTDLANAEEKLKCLLDNF